MFTPTPAPTVSRPLPAFVQAALPVESAEQFAMRRTHMKMRKDQRRAAKPQWRPMYGYVHVLVSNGKPGLLDASGNIMAFDVKRKFSHAPGDIIESRGGKRTYGGYKDIPRYMVREDHSLHRI